MAKKVKKTQLTPKRELFCQYYVSEDFFGNGGQAYMKAYKIKKGKEPGARVLASGLLTNIKVLDRINEIMEHAVLNDEFVDREIGWLIQQKDDKAAKNKAIETYNKIKNRYEQHQKAGSALTDLAEAVSSFANPRPAKDNPGGDQGSEGASKTSVQE